MQRGKIIHRERARQIRNFSGLCYGTITPTDIDGLIEYQDKGFILYETKLTGCDLPYGQRLAIERLIDSINKPAVAFVSTHDTDTTQDIDMANTTVTEIYYKGKWRECSPNSLKIMTDRFIVYLNNG